MGKFSERDKILIEELCKRGWGYRRICSYFPEKQWKLDSVKSICKRFTNTGSAVTRAVGSGRPKSARSATNVEKVSELICSQEGQPGTSKSAQQIADNLGISKTSVRRIAKKDLGLSCFKRTTVQALNADAKRKRLLRCRALLRRLSVAQCKRVFFTDEKAFYLSPLANTQNDRVWAAGKKREVAAERLLNQRSKFSRKLMVSAGVCYGGKSRLHFVAEGVKISAQTYTETLLPLLVEDCSNLLQHDYVFQQDGAPGHFARQTQEWLATNCPDFINKDQWPPNSPDLNPLDYCVWGIMQDAYKKYEPKPTQLNELKVVLQTIWDSLSRDLIDRAVVGFRKRLQACVKANGGHFEHVLK